MNNTHLEQLFTVNQTKIVKNEAKKIGPFTLVKASEKLYFGQLGTFTQAGITRRFGSVDIKIVQHNIDGNAHVLWGRGKEADSIIWQTSVVSPGTAGFKEMSNQDSAKISSDISEYFKKALVLAALPEADKKAGHFLD